MYKILAIFLTALTVSGCSVFGSMTNDKGVPYVFSPPAQGKHPGIIVLHTHSGLHNYEIEYARDLSRKGFISAVVDYYAPGGTDNIGKAYDMLLKNPNIDPDKIGMIGFSKGAKYAIDHSNWETRFGNRKYSAIVSYYIGPHVGSTNESLPPILFLHGDQDVYVSKQSIQEFIKTQNKYGQIAEAKIYPGVKHAFPHRFSRYDGYNANATSDAEKSTILFFNKHLKN